MIRYYCNVPKQSPDEKVWQKIIPRQEVFTRLKANQNYLSIIQDKNYELEKSGSNYRYQLIPCRHCWSCQLKYAAEWATRLTWESQRYEHKYYITLTYDEEHVPIFSSMLYTDKDGKTTEYENDGTWNGSLEPKDMNKFINTLRKHYERQGIKDIKYFYCGEYGGKTERPHYHMILFGAPLKIEQFYDFYEDPKHKKLHWKSKELDKWWNKGMIDVAEVEWNSCAYVARYCMKKISNENDGRIYAEKGKYKEFIRMSRKPGIGMRYYDENLEKIYENDEVIQKTIKGNTSAFKPPKAFDRKFKESHPEQWEKIKASREAAAERNRLLKADLTRGITDLELLQREAEKTISKGNMLKRLGVE